MQSSLPWKSINNTAYKVAVLGDLILDEYIEGDVSRISPEAPVPVNLVKQTTHRPGGASNAALNVQRVGGQACLFGVWGKDRAAEDLNKILLENKIDCAQILKDPKRTTTKKTRITANRQQIVRVDWERAEPISAEVERKLTAAIDGASFDSLLISDYGKGGLTATFIKSAVAIARKRHSKVVIDPKGTDYERYRGAYVITPNRKEACEALGIDPQDKYSKEDLAKRLIEKFDLENVLVTLGPEGMFLYQRDGGDKKSLYLPAVAREVFDVSGAGDTVAAVVALGLASGVTLERSVALANLAAAVVVGKWGTQPIEEHELEYAVTHAAEQFTGTISSKNKIKHLSDLKRVLGPIGTRRRKVVFTNGCFDILHAGHVQYLEKARSLGDILVVAVNSDASVRKLKGPSRPVVSAEHRQQMLAALACVDYVVEFTQDTPLDVIQELVPNVLVKGADWEKAAIVGGDVVTQAGGQVDTIEFLPGLSTTEVIKRIKSDQGIDIR